MTDERRMLKQGLKRENMQRIYASVGSCRIGESVGTSGCDAERVEG